MSGSSSQAQSGGGIPKMILAAVPVLIGVFVAISNLSEGLRKLSDVDHGLASTIIFSFFVIYVMADMIRWSRQTSVWIYGIAVIAMAAYWWIGFMAMHGIPPEPIIPAKLNPPQWAYFTMAAGIAGWAFWDMKEALNDQDFSDNGTVATGAIVLLIGIALSLYLTIHGPIGS